MTEIVKETIHTGRDQEAVDQVVVANSTGNEETVVKQVKVAATDSQKAEYVIYFFFGAIEILLAFRLVLKVMGASVLSIFVRGIYSITELLIIPFEGIFRRGISQGIETASVLEPSTIMAILVYAILAWSIVKFLGVISGERKSS